MFDVSDYNTPPVTEYWHGYRPMEDDSLPDGAVTAHTRLRLDMESVEDLEAEIERIDELPPAKIDKKDVYLRYCCKAIIDEESE